MRISDWSSDVCSSDLLCARPSVGRCPRRKARRDESSRALFAYRRFLRLRSFVWMTRPYSARSEERRVGKESSVRVDLGGRRIIKKKNDNNSYFIVRQACHECCKTPINVRLTVR